MAKKKCPECEECLPAWLAAFGDLMSLLLCFFVLLLSMSSMDAKKISEAIGSLSGAMSVLEDGTKTEISKKRIQESTPIESQDETSEVVNRIQQAAGDANEMMEKTQSPTVTVEEAQDGFVIKLPASLLFKPGSATIENQDALLFLKRIALITQELPNEMEVSAQGHTDDVQPGADSPFKDNWELSAARAISVVHELILDGIAPKRLSASGYAQYRPIATNATPAGREKNRRVELHFYGQKKEKQAAVGNTILDKAVQDK
ncbi:flagellar motor protein MotB [Sulfurimonas sp.]|uniref:OmpA/MotB family protein n=1 Tax=Sulfurimonas sp. TaxID=2022749 RepID=UPI00263647CE|nr:flagellar motor protein MotB [Sulfurimonas sp.]